ncbi:putative general amidase GmdA [Macrophomina phaseolina]|uniref:General amidase GmdA n=1 Tax=Macrophomina phaseolina TaxID=35725 RepID=A0ABQ8FUQ5_9PEZI|nr:putative general amidase GmdA [Macrophomina phaseolina]
MALTVWLLEALQDVSRVTWRYVSRRDAEQLDAHFQKHRRPVGPLHGLPISLKDTIHVRGVETTMGAETGNNIIGYTANPHNRLLTAGRSSSGEGALIALRGSLAGLRTGIGTSVTLPSHFNGLHALRPSYYRLPLRGVATPIDGQDTVPFVVGPMATTSRATFLLIKSLLSCESWLSDPMVHEIPWRDHVYVETLKRASGTGRKLALGVFRLDNVASALRSAGHEIIEFSLPKYSEALQLFFKVCFIDGAADVLAQFALSSESPDPTMPAIFKTNSPKVLDATEVMRTNKAIRAYRAEFVDHWNNTANAAATRQPVDAVIMPVSPSAAPKRGKVRWLGYKAIINLLDYASYVIPVTRVDKAVDAPSPHAPLSEKDEFLLNDHDPELYHGAPVGLQIVGRRLQEEKVLALGEFLTSAISKRDA